MPTVAQQVALHHLEHPVAQPTSTATRVSRLRTAAVPAIPEPVDGPESEPLFFPHTLETDELDMCAPSLAEMESRLRLGQMRSSLDKLRVHLHIKSRLLVFKARNVRHQASNTRSMGQIDSNELKIVGFAEKYRAARCAYLELVGPGSWENEWRALERSDVRCLRDATNIPAPDETGGTEGQREVSWIWQTGDRHDLGGDAEELPGIKECEYKLLYSPLS